MPFGHIPTSKHRQSEAVAQTRDAGGRPRLLYLALFDPTNTANGTCARGRAVLRVLKAHFEISLVFLQGQHVTREDKEAVSGLASRDPVKFTRAGYFGFSPALYSAAKRAIVRHKPAVIFADLEKAGVYAWPLARKFGIPFVYSSHNVEYQRFVNLAKTNILRLAFVPWLYLAELLSLKKAAATIAISSTDAETFRRMAPRASIHALPLSFDEDVFNPHDLGQTDLPPVVLMVGNLRYPPNRESAQRLLKHVVPAVASQIPQVVFRFVGDGFPAGLAGPNVEVAGFVNDLPAEYRRAAVVVVPIEMGGGLKIKAIEALACGRSLVATPKGMEGIEHEGLDLVQVGPLAQFPAMIIDALRGATATSRNWERVRAAYGAQSQSARLADILRGAIPLTATID